MPFQNWVVQCSFSVFRIREEVKEEEKETQRLIGSDLKLTLEELILNQLPSTPKNHTTVIMLGQVGLAHHGQHTYPTF